MTSAKLSVPKAATALIVEFEGFSSTAYLDRIASPPVWTLGTGFTRGVKPGQTITRAENARRLVRELREDYLPAVRAACLNRPNTNQLSALLSFVFNVGVGGVSAITKVGHALRGGHWADAADRLLDWCKAGGKVIAGLQRRRRAERKLMLAPVKAKDPFHGYMPYEKEALRQYDDWKRRGVNLEGRKRLREEMTVMRKEVWRAANKPGEGGWAKNRRRERYRSLKARTA